MTGILSIKNLVVDFKLRAGNTRALNQVSLELMNGEILGIVGESGCGKSMTALSIMGLIPSPPGKITGGSIIFDGEELLTASKTRMRQIRGGIISMIFQHSMTSLNPVLRIGDQIAECVLLHEEVTKVEAWARAVETLTMVGIPEPEIRAWGYPHELSVGMRQRVMIAMALSCRPRVLIVDEPTAALDVTVQAQIFDLLKDLQRETGIAIIMTTHDMGAIAELADRVAVLYAGHIIETGSTRDILTNPQHPYTRGLISCVPYLGENPTEVRPYLTEIKGVMPSLTGFESGCAFAPRCPYKTPICEEVRPENEAVIGVHTAACHNLKYVAAV